MESLTGDSNVDKAETNPSLFGCSLFNCHVATEDNSGNSEAQVTVELLERKLEEAEETINTLSKQVAKLKEELSQKA